MTHKLKALGLTLMAICLIGAVGASGAQATKFTSAKYPTSLTGTQTSQHRFPDDVRRSQMRRRQLYRQPRGGVVHNHTRAYLFEMHYIRTFRNDHNERL